MQIPLVVGPNQSSSPVGEGYTPAQMQQAYGFNQITLPAGESFNDAGSGQTIAIIDALDDPYIVSDLQTFDKTFGIGGTAGNPASTSFFKVVNEYGGSNLPPTDQGQFGYGIETSLDVEWAHAMAPGANILLVEASTPSFNDLGTAIEFAARLPGVSVVSLSFGHDDWGTEYYLDNIFTTSSGHQGVSFVASAGDSGGFSPEYPAMSPNVLSVGGTTLPPDASGNPDRALEYAWSSGGGGISSSEAEPAYQLGVQSTGSRTGPDLAYDADENTGVAVYDTLLANAVSPGEPWFKVGGTSMGAPQISSLVAIANQLRVAAGEGTLDGPNQLLPAIYQIAATDPNAFQDITSGNNYYQAGPGYDLATGLGTPNAQYLVPDLVAAYPKPATPDTLYWTGDVDSNWNMPGNWSTVDPLVTNAQQSILPTSNNNVVVDLSGATILHDATNYDTIRSFTVTAPNVTLDVGAGTVDLSGGGGRGTFRVDHAGDAVTMEAGILANADVTSGTTLYATSGPYGEYPELDDVQLDGTLNANQSGGNNGIVFSNGLIVNGTINLGGTSDQSSVLAAGYFDPFAGNQDNNSETISGTGTIQLGQSQDGDAIYNWGTLGTFTVGPHITVLGGGPGSTALFEQTTFTGGLDNQGTIEENGGTLVIAASGPALYGWEPSTTTGWTNEGTIAETGATLGLLGGWINYGTISADNNSTVLLGSPTSGQIRSDPYAAYDAWSSLGSVTIGNGATVYVGGFLTTDEYLGAESIPGFTADPALDSLFLYGTLDNSPADNSASGGVLALNAATGPLQLIGGTVIGGTISSSGSDDVEVFTATPLPNIQVGGFFTGLTAAGGSLRNLTNDGTVNATGITLTLKDVTNNGTINGTGADVSFGNTWDNANGTIAIDPSSILDLGTPASTDPNFPPTLADASGSAWYVSDVGTIDAANGATIVFGGLMTADLFTAFQSLPHVHVDLAQDTVLLSGWLDDSPADNPETGGVLAFTSATGAVDLAGGFIYQGTITTSGTGAVDVVDNGGVPSSGGGVLDGVTNDGTIAVLSNDFLYFEGAVTNNGTFAASSGFISFLPGGSLTNNGSLNLTSDGTSSLLFFCNSSIVNNGTIAVQYGALEVYPLDPQSPPVTLTNTGTIAVTDFSEILVAGGLRNAGTISGTNSYLFFEGSWDNTTGTVRVDSSSHLFLGFPTSYDPNYPPPIADASPYALNLSQVGTIDVANGGSLGLGGLMTTDQFNAFHSLPGGGINFPQVTVLLTGWLDNSPSDNPTSHGVLTINASTGPLYLDDGYIYQGKINTSGSNDLEVVGTGFLDAVELDGNLNVTGPFGGAGTIIVLNSLTLNGTIEMPGSFGRIGFGYFDNTPETLRGTGTIFLGESGTDEALLFDLNNAGLTIDSGITIDAGAAFSEFAAEGSTIENLGTVEDNTASSMLYTYGISPSTNEFYNGIANYSAGTLTGGTWEIGGGATWQIYGFDLTANAANLSVSGTGTQVLDSIFDAANNALAGFKTNTAKGSFTVGAGYNFTAPGAFSNAGVVDIQRGAGFSAGSSTYSQSAGTTTVDGTLTAANVSINGGGLDGTGTIAGSLTNAAIVTPGDAPGMLTIQGNYTQTSAGALDINLAGTGAYGQLTISGTATLTGALNVTLTSGFTPAAGAWFTILTFAARSGDFSTETGLSLSKNKFFVPCYGSNGLTLVLGPGVSVVSGIDLTIIGGLTSNDQVQIKPIGNSNTGSTGVQVTATLNGASTTTTFGQAFSAIDVFGFGGNDSISLTATLTVSTNISAGGGNDNVTAGNGPNFITLGNGNDNFTAGGGSNTITLGNGNENVTAGNGPDTIALGNGNDNVAAGSGPDTIALGNGNDNVTAGNGPNTIALGNGNDNVTSGNGNNTITLGYGNDTTKVGNGSNVVVEGNGNDNITAGNGDNLVVAGLGQHTVHAGNGSDILIDGSVKLTESGDSLRHVLDDWAQYGALAADVASIRSRVVVTYNSSHANTMDAGSGLDWFWEKYAKDSTNRKSTDLLN